MLMATEERRGFATTQGAPVERIDEDFGFRRVYNLTVSEFHTFFVGGVGWGFSVWVHNQSWCEQIAKLRDAIKSGVPEAIAKERASTKAMIESAGKDPKLADDIRKSLAKGRSVCVATNPNTTSDRIR